MGIRHITQLLVPQHISISRVLLDDCSYGYDCNNQSNYPPPPPPPSLPPPLPPPPYHDPDEAKSSYKFLSSRNVFLMSCSFVVIIIMIYVFLILRKYMLNRRRSDPRVLAQMNDDFVNEDQGPELIHPIWFINTIGLQQSLIDSIAIFTYKKDEVLVEGTDCSVCLSEFQEDERLRLLPKCSHAFHVPCIDTWLRAHKNCPLCRAPVVVEANNVDVSVVEQDADGVVSNEDDLVNGIEVGNEQEIVENVGDLVVLVEQGDASDDSGNSSSYFCARNVNVRFQSDLVDHVVNMGVELQQTRRSISLDSSSASLFHLAVANVACDGDRGKLKKVESRKGGSRHDSIFGMVTSSSFRRYSEKRPISMKRSFSASGKKYSKQRSSRSQDSILPF